MQLARGPSHALSPSSAQKNKSCQKIEFLAGIRSWPRSFQARAALQVGSHRDIQLEEISAGGGTLVQRRSGKDQTRIKLRFTASFSQTSSVWCVCKALALGEWHTTIVHLSREGAQGKKRGLCGKSWHFLQSSGLPGCHNENEIKIKKKKIIIMIMIMADWGQGLPASAAKGAEVPKTWLARSFPEIGELVRTLKSPSTPDPCSRKHL